MIRYYIFYLLIFCIFIPGCSHYSFSGMGTPGIKTIAIPIFEDKSAEFQIQEKLTNAVVERFLRDNTLKVREINEADAVLHGTITRVEDHPIALNQDERAQEFEFYIYVMVTYEAKGATKPLFSENLRGRGTYADPADRDSGMNDAISKLANDILNLVVTGW